MEQIAVIFDMDGLMLDTERMARVAWRRALAERGFDLADESYLRLVGRTVEDARVILTELFGPALPFQQVYEQRTEYYNQDIEQNGIPRKPGLLELLDFLEERGIPKAVASSTPCQFAARKLAHAGIDRRFAAVVCGDMVERGKPAPDLFLEAARRLSAPPERCVVLEDSEAGIMAAHAAGMIPIMVPDLKLPSPEIRGLTYKIVPSLNEVIPVLEAFLNVGLPA